MNKALSIPLYHGTSSLFLKLIQKHGLGGVNIIQELKVRESLETLFELCSMHCPEDNWWKNHEYIISAMVRQSNSGIFNFRHGSVYLSASRFVAARYAIGMEYGSEMITHAVWCYEKIRHYGVEVDPMKHPFTKLLGINKFPILVEVKNVDPSLLLNEKGGPATKLLEELSECNERSPAANEENDVFFQSFDFELAGTIRPEDLIFTKIRN